MYVLAIIMYESVPETVFWIWMPNQWGFGESNEAPANGQKEATMWYSRILAICQLQPRQVAGKGHVKVKARGFLWFFFNIHLGDSRICATRLASSSNPWVVQAKVLPKNVGIGIRPTIVIYVYLNKVSCYNQLLHVATIDIIVLLLWYFCVSCCCTWLQGKP